jgi:AbrB family looped-hinge helix DNA binding protein
MHETQNHASLSEFFYGAVTVGERGQVVIPAEARKLLHLEPGDKLLVFRHPHAPGLALARVDDVQDLLTLLQRMADALANMTGEGASDG